MTPYHPSTALALFLAGCGTDSDDYDMIIKVAPEKSSEDSQPEASEPDATGFSVTKPEPSLAFDEVIMRMKTSLARGIPNPLEARFEYALALAQGGDPNCPGQGYSFTTAFSGCTSQNDWFYAGVAEYTGPQSMTQNVFFPWQNFNLITDLRIRNDQDQWFYNGGEIDFEVIDEFAWNGAISGTWSYPNGPEWMTGPGAGGVLTMAVQGDSNNWVIHIDGSINADGAYIHLRDVELASEHCDGAVTGDLGWRGEDGYWYRLLLDCGCGAMTFAQETEMDFGCVDLLDAFTPLLEL